MVLAWYMAFRWRILGEGPLTRARGSRSYMAPEMLAGEGYAFPADMWSFGVLVYATRSHETVRFASVWPSNPRFPLCF